MATRSVYMCIYIYICQTIDKTSAPVLKFGKLMKLNFHTGYYFFCRGANDVGRVDVEGAATSRLPRPGARFPATWIIMGYVFFS